MAIIAVAGGTSKTLGRSIARAISKTSKTPIILSRASNDLPARMYGAEIRAVDYEDQVPGPFWDTCQINLLHAAHEAGVKRFAPAEFELGPDADGRVDVMGLKTLVRDAIENFRAKGMECTRFSNGMFMNYLGCGFDFQSNHEHEDQMLEGLGDPPILWDIAKRTAALPVKDDGTYPHVTMTSIGDIGRFVAAACELPDGKWLPVMSMVGETVNCGEVTSLIEEIFPERAIAVTKLTKLGLEKKTNAIPGIGSTREEVFDKMIAQINLLVLEDEAPGKCVLEPVFNRPCPHVQPTTVREYLTRLARS